MNLRSLALGGLLVLIPVAAAAQTVPRAPGSTFVSLEQSNYQSTQYYDDNGQLQPNGCLFQKNATTLYLEHGFTPRNTGSVQFEYDHLSCGGRTTDGLYDVELAFLHEMSHSATTHLSWKAEALVPTGYSIGANPRIGYGRLGGQYGAVYAGNFRSIGGYGFYSIEAAVRAYFGYPAPQLRTFGTIGEDISPAVQLIGEVEWNQALGAGQTLVNEGLNPLVFPRFNDGQAFGTVRIRLTPHLSLVGSTSYVFYGRDYGLGSTNAIGLWGDF